METQDTRSNTPEPVRPYQDITTPDQMGRVLGGVVIVIIGGLLLARSVGADLPGWLFTWPMIPIAIGLFIGAKHRFRHPGWLIPIAVGAVFLTINMFSEDVDSSQFFWPVIIIAIGLFMIIRPRRHGRFRGRDRETWKRWHERRHQRYQQQFGADFVEETAEGMIDSVTIFGGTKKVVISKDFKGGDAVTVFGGVEINLTQADIQGRAVLELVQIFGGAKLVVPSDWKIQADEMVSIFGGLDDKRNPAALHPNDDKVLILKGTSIFGGIDIKSY
ncbi:cell wall-active antibiotics response protein [Parachryseolinea silvisoli]|jgi:predicted membrane protein|uniref:cell wall-active antibiotics response protein n=1 Tax=Parachryseolinea silvisoli TaxID=2873601 RepID=UPI002265A04B|nr:cell wall-active antibiotics response protein [Parachryseolinea silvisoli]MCD9014982.1 cell wall-active antibiotics response protein [Parachryseolinea silvisoli]